LSSRAEVRDKVRGEYRFSSVVKQKIKAKICFVIYIAGFFFKKNLCYEVIVKQKIYKRSNNHYCDSDADAHSDTDAYAAGAASESDDSCQ